MSLNLSPDRCDILFWLALKVSVVFNLIHTELHVGHVGCVLLLFCSVVLLVDELLAALSEMIDLLVQSLQETFQLLLSAQQTVDTVHRVLHQ